MKTVVFALGAAALTAGTASAGGIDRTRIGYGLLFEPGTYVEFSYSNVSPEVSGGYVAGLGGGNTGDMAGHYSNLAFTYKRDINDKLSFGFFLNEPYGADASYKQGVYTGLDAEWKSQQLAAVLRYEVTPAVSVYGGARYVESSANILIPDALIRGGFAAAGAAGNATAAAIAAGAPPGSLTYTAEGDRDGAFGYVLGAAYEKPEIALRVGLTYESELTHKLATSENIPAFGLLPGTAPFPDSTTEIKMPQTITLDFQSGVAKDTLVFGSIRWSEWSVWEVRPAGYESITGDNITDFEDDVITYQLGVGRRLNENFSVFARLGYEKKQGGISSRLSPTDGMKSIGIGGTYTKDNMKLTAGVEYVELGDAIDGSGTVFEGSKALGVGISVGYRF